jgi:putative chitinase
MPRVYIRTDLTKEQAEELAAAAKNDIPVAATDVEVNPQSNGLYTVISTYPDAAAQDAADAGGGQPAPAPVPPPQQTQAKPQPPVKPVKKPQPVQLAPQAQPVQGVQPAQPAAANANGIRVPTLAMLQRLWPKAAADVIQGISNTAPAAFAKTQIDTPLRAAHFMAQISEECGAGLEMIESLNYTAQRMMAVWPSRFPTLASAQPFAHNQRALGDKVYNGRMGNQSGTDDGYNYRGRGLLQITGRDSYQKMGQLCDIDLVGDPDLAIDPRYALLVAATEFEQSGCLKWCDEDSVLEVSALINLGHLTANPNPIVGFSDRESWLKTWKHEFGL